MVSVKFLCFSWDAAKMLEIPSRRVSPDNLLMAAAALMYRSERQMQGGLVADS